MKAVIIDDEQQARNTLKGMLSNLSIPVEIVGEGWNLESAISCISETRPNLIFLDVQLEDGSGFDVLKALNKLQADIIFVTAFDHYAVRAFQAAAFGYLLKPISLVDLNTVLERYMTEFDQKSQLASRTKILIEQFDTGQVKKIVIQNVQGFKVVPINEILYLKGEVNYTRFFLRQGEVIMTSKTLKSYASILEDHGFFRIHQSFLVNLNEVAEYIKGEGGLVVISNGDQLSVSRRRKQQFIQNFLG